MQKLKTRNEYVGCNRKCRFYVDEIRATSYDWNFVRKIGGKVVFNNYTYSSTTSRHQWRIRHLMDELGIKIDLYINMEPSLTDSNFYEHALDYYYSEYFKTLCNIYTKGTRKKTNEVRREYLNKLTEKIKTLKDLGCTFHKSRFNRYFFSENKDRHVKRKVKEFVKENKGKVFFHSGKSFKVLKIGKCNYTNNPIEVEDIKTKRKTIKSYRDVGNWKSMELLERLVS